MATNFMNYLSSSCASADSSSSDGDGMNSGSAKVDLSYHGLDDDLLEVNLRILAQTEEEEEDENGHDDGSTPVTEYGKVTTRSKKVQKLLLYNNNLVGVTGAVRLFENLTVLDMSNNNIGSLPYHLNHMHNLIQLFLRNNLIGDQSFPKTLSGLQKLRDLNLSGNRLTHIPNQICELTGLRNLFMGGNQILEVPQTIKSLKRLKVFYLGGNFIRSLPPHAICKLTNLHALILCNNQLESLPQCILSLKRLQCLQLHGNRLTTLPEDLVKLGSLNELTLRDNPLVSKFVRDMSYEPSSLLELSARVIISQEVPYNPSEVPFRLHQYLSTSHECVNPNCNGVYFDAKVEHIKFVDFCGKYKIPLMQYLCSPKCSVETPAVKPTLAGPSANVTPPPVDGAAAALGGLALGGARGRASYECHEDRMRRVLLG